MTIEQLKQKNQRAAAGFAAQRQVIKQVLAGQLVNCQHCRGPIQLISPSQSGQIVLSCGQACTHIELDLQ